MTLGTLIKLATEPIEIPEGDHYGLGKVRDFSNKYLGTNFTFGGDTTIDTTPRELMPKNDLSDDLSRRQSLVNAYQQGQNDASDRSILGFAKPWTEHPDYISAKPPTDPWLRELDEAKRQGYNDKMKGYAMNASEYAARLSRIAPYGVPQVADRLAGAITNGKMGVTDWNQTRSANDIQREYANDVTRTLDNPDTPQGRDYIAFRTGLTANSPWTAGMKDWGRAHPDSPIGTVGNALGRVEDFGNELFNKGSLINVGLAGPVGKALTFGKMRPGMRIAAEGAALAAPDWVYAASPEAAMWIGKRPMQQDERAARLTYGDAIANRMANDKYMGYWSDDNGNYTFSGSQIKDPAKFGQALGYFPDYGQYLQQHDIAPEHYANQNVLMNYVMNRVGTGTAGTELFNTPMFQMLDPSNKAKAFDTWLEKRYISAERNDKIGWNSADSKAVKLSKALASDSTGVLRNGIQNFFRYADAPTIANYLGSHAGGAGGGTEGDMDALYGVLKDSIVMNMRENPGHITPLVQDLVKLKASQDLLAKNDPNASMKGAEVIKAAFKDVMKDPEVTSQMSARDREEFIAAVAPIMETPGGAELLGGEADEAAMAAVRNLQGDVLGAAIRHPDIIPKLAGSWTATHISPEAGKYVSNPWVFWSVLATLAAGGVIAASSVFDDDEDEDDEERQYRKAIRLLSR